MPLTRMTRSIAAAGTLAAAACRGGDGSPIRSAAANGTVLEAPSCAGDSLRPATAAPAEGLWIGVEPASEVRVAALVGPARARTGDLQLMRRVETIEVQATGDTLRTKVDAASVRLELLPWTTDTALGPGDTTSPRQPAQPAATYVVTPAIRVAAYEPCAVSIKGPRLRYLRRDTGGRIIVDVMLRRASAGS